MDSKKLAAEAIGTFWLTLGGCGSAVRGWVSSRGYWVTRRGPRFRPHIAHDGVCHRTHLRVPHQSRGDCGIDMRRAVSAQPRAPIHRSRAFRWRLGAVATLVVLGGTFDRGRCRWLPLSLAERGARRRGDGSGLIGPNKPLTGDEARQIASSYCQVAAPNDPSGHKPRRTRRRGSASISRTRTKRTRRSLCWSSECPVAHVSGEHRLRFPPREAFQLRNAPCLATETMSFPVTT
jgi:hypothetical protein